MKLIEDISAFSHRTSGDGFDSTCRVRVFSEDDGSRNVVIYEETGEGRSVTNAAETIATRVCNHFNLDPEKTTFIEYYPGNQLKPYMNEDEKEGSFDLVTFDQWPKGVREAGLYSPLWKRITRQTAEKLCGCKI